MTLAASAAVPGRARVVIIVAAVIGCSVAYQFAHAVRPLYDPTSARTRA